MADSSRPRWWFIVVLGLLGCIGVLAGATVAGGGVTGDLDHYDSQYEENGVNSASSAGTSIANETDIQADFTHLSAEIRDTGDATWSIIYRQRLDDDDEIAAFEDLQSDIEEDPSAYLDPFEHRLQQLLSTAENATGREMVMENLSIQTERTSQVQGEFGLVTVSFDWLEFAIAEDGEIQAGDAIDRFFLEENQDLAFAWPDGYDVGSVNPEPAVVGDTRVIWQGRLDFAANEPRLGLTRAVADAPPENETVTVDVEDEVLPDDESDDDDRLVALPVLIGAIAIGLAAIAVVVYRRTEIFRDRANSGTDGGEAGGEQPNPTGSTGNGADLLSTEERILQLLERNGGRMKQKAVTQELDWSGARTSQVVGEMRAAGKIESFRIGRENVLTLPDVDLDTTAAAEDATEDATEHSTEDTTEDSTQDAMEPESE